MDSPATIAALLYRPYLDLSLEPHPEAPYHVIGLCWAVEEALEHKNIGFIQASVNSSFRDELTSATALAAYAGRNLAAVDPAVRSDAWNALLALRSRAESLDPERKLRVAWAVSRIGFHAEALEILGPSNASPPIAYLRAWCRFRLSLDDESSFDPEEFAHVFMSCSPGITKIDSAYQMTKHYSKSRSDLVLATEWQKRHSSAIAEVKNDLEEQTLQRLGSRYHRVGGFLPQLEGDVEGVAREMAKAESLARTLDRSNEVDALLADEMLYPCLESRIKEALWSRDLALALDRANEYLEMRPLDPKASLHRGDVLVEMSRWEEAATSYNFAATLAPPGGAISYFMLGQCLEMMGVQPDALSAYLCALEIDPAATSALEGVERTGSSVAGGTALVRYARERLGSLKAAATR